MKTGGSSLYTFRSPSSGTVASTTYTSKGSRLSSVSMESAMHFEVEANADQEKREQEEKWSTSKAWSRTSFVHRRPIAASTVAMATSMSLRGGSRSWASAGFSTSQGVHLLGNVSILILLILRAGSVLMPLLFPDGSSGGENTSTPKQLQFEHFFSRNHAENAHFC